MLSFFAICRSILRRKFSSFSYSCRIPFSYYYVDCAYTIIYRCSINPNDLEDIKHVRSKMDHSIDHSAHLFDRSTTPPHLVSPLESPRFPPQRPPPRIPSTSSISFAAQVPPSKTPSPSFQAFEFDDTSGRYQGLGISSRRESISRVPVGSRGISNSSPPNPAIPFDSPSTAAAASPYTPASSSNPFLTPIPKSDSRNVNNPYNGRRLSTMLEGEQDISSSRSIPSEDMTENQDTELGENRRGYGDNESLNDKSGRSVFKAVLYHLTYFTRRIRWLSPRH